MSRDLGESTPPQQNSNDLNDLRKGPATKNLPSIASWCRQLLHGILQSTITHRSQSIGDTVDELEALSA